MPGIPELNRLRQEDYLECETCTPRLSFKKKKELGKEERDRDRDYMFLIMHELKTKL